MQKYKNILKVFVVLLKSCIFATLTDDNCTYPVGQAVNLLNIGWAFFYAHTLGILAVAYT